MTGDPDEHGRQAWRAAGLYDPEAPGAAERLELLEFLVGQGCTLPELVLAHERGRLFALGGDRRVRPLLGLLSLNEAAARLDADVALLARAWRTFGLPDPPVGAAVLTEADVEALGTVLLVQDLLGTETALALCRVMGSSLARISEAESSAMRAGMSVIDLGTSGSELSTARSWTAVTELVPRIGRMLDALHRQHLEATRLHFEGLDPSAARRLSFRCGIGFADLSGFTRLSATLPLEGLSAVLSVFEESAADTVNAHGGRVVKFLGDAVMWVCADPDALARTALDLVSHPRAVAAGLQVRAGLATGAVLAQDGDYFGTPVNLAARLVSVASPGQVLLAGELAEALAPRWRLLEEAEQDLRGFEDRVPTWSLAAD